MTALTVDEKQNALEVLVEELFSSIPTDDPLYPLRRKAWNQFVELGGLPTTKQDPFRHFPLRKLYQQDCERGASTLAFQGADEAVVMTLSEAMKTYGAFIEHRWRQLLKQERDPFALLNMALHEESLFVYLPPGKTLEHPMEITLTLSPESLWLPRMQFFLGRQAELAVRIHVMGDTTTSVLIDQIDLVLEEGASCTAIQQSQSDFQLHSVRCFQKRDSRFRSLYTTSGGVSQRDDYHVVMGGENSSTELSGLWRLQQSQQSHSHVIVEHQAPNCRSRQHFKGALENHSRSSFEGKIYVHQEAQQTDAFQMNNNLLIGERTHADSRPNLEIFADDVKASHGSTVGQLDEEHLFYLKTRGIHEQQAKALLVQAFCEEVLQPFHPYLILS